MKNVSHIQLRNFKSHEHTGTQQPCFTPPAPDLRPSSPSMLNVNKQMNSLSNPLKRRREYLEASNNHNSELVRFVLATQDSQSNPFRDSSPYCTADNYSSVRGNGMNIQSRSVQRKPMNDDNPFGLQKRRLVDSFEGMSLGSTHTAEKQGQIKLTNMKNSQNHQPQGDGVDDKKVLIQVLDSVEFDPNAEKINSQIGSHMFDQLDNGDSYIDYNSSYCNEESWNDIDGQNQDILSNSATVSCKSSLKERRHAKQMLRSPGKMSSRSSRGTVNKNSQKSSPAKSKFLSKYCKCADFEDDFSHSQSSNREITANQDSSFPFKDGNVDFLMQQKLDFKNFQEGSDFELSEQNKQNFCDRCGLIQKQQKQNLKPQSKDEQNQSTDFVRLEITDEDMREHVINQLKFEDRSYFLDKANPKQYLQQHQQQARSRSQNTRTVGSDYCEDNFNAFMSDSDSNKGRSDNVLNYCSEIEIRHKVIESKKHFLKNFFSYYLKSIMTINEQLNLSYFEKLQQEYSALRSRDKLSFTELQESVDEMMVDETAKAHIYEFLHKQTNYSDLVMSEQQSTNSHSMSAQSSLNRVADQTNKIQMVQNDNQNNFTSVDQMMMFD